MLCLRSEPSYALSEIYAMPLNISCWTVPIPEHKSTEFDSVNIASGIVHWTQLLKNRTHDTATVN